MITCKVNTCPYNYFGQFCKKEFASIDQNGCCRVLWRKGRQKQNIAMDNLDKMKQINIVDVEFKELSQQEEKQRLDEVFSHEFVNRLVRSSIKRGSRKHRLIKIK